MTPRSAARAAAFAALLAAWNPCSAVAQQSRVSPFLQEGHWAVDLARTLDGLGLMPTGFDPGFGRQHSAEILAGLERAARESDLAADGLRRLREELGEDWLGEGPVGAGEIVFGAESNAGRLSSGQRRTGDDQWSPAVPIEDRAGAIADVAGFGRADRFAWGLRAGLSDDGVGLEEGYGMVAAGKVALWAGFLPDGYHGVPTGSVVVSATRPGPGAGLGLLDGVRLPGFLRAIGPIRFSTHLFRAAANGAFAHPWLLMMRGSVAPHRRLDLGVSRAIMMGGEGNDELTARSLLFALIGKHSGAFDNQVVAVTARYRLPGESVLPLVAYLEWGFEDSAGAWQDVPGIIASLESPSLPFAPRASAGVALTRFEASCCGNPIWYRNWAFEGGWTDDGRPLGHPLGGHGREWLAYGSVLLNETRVRVEGGAFSRWRGEENLFASHRAGYSAGGRLEVVVLPMAGWRGFGAAELDRAVDGGWQAHRLEAGIVAFF